MKKIFKLSEKNYIYIILGILFVLMFILNCLTPLIADDFSYSIGLNSHKIKNLFQVFEYQVNHYLTWGGRTVAHTIAQVFLIMPKIIFNIFNSIMQVLEVYLIYKIAKQDKKDNPLLLILIFALLWLFLPVFGVSNIWLIGSCNYLWTTVFILFFIYEILKDKKDSKKTYILMFLLGIISGWTNENTSFGCITIVALIIIFKGIKNINKNKWRLYGLVGNILGFIIMIVAPGNFIRSKGVMEEGSLIYKICKRFIIYTENISLYLLPLIVLVTILISICIYMKRKIDNKAIFFILGSFTAIYSMLLSPQFPDRAWTGVVVFLIVSSMIMLFDLLNIRIIKIIVVDFLVIFTFMFARDYLLLMVDTNNYRRVWNYRENEIARLKDEGKNSAEFEQFFAQNKRNPGYGLADIQPDPDHWANTFVAKYYELDIIKSK